MRWKSVIVLALIVLIITGISVVVTMSRVQHAPVHRVTQNDPLGPISQPGTSSRMQWFSISSLPTDLLVQIWFDDIGSRPDPDEETQQVWVRVKDKTGSAPWSEARVQLKINCFRGNSEEMQAYVVNSDPVGQLAGLTQVPPGKILPNSATDLVIGTLCH